MGVDRELLREFREARQDLVEHETRARRARVRYEHAIRRLHASGASFRDIGDLLGVSRQRVHAAIDPSRGRTALRRYVGADPCSFCGSVPNQSDGGVTGPGAFICGRCADLADATLDTGGGIRSGAGKLIGVGSDRPEARCTFCGRHRSEVDGMVEAPQSPGIGRYARRAPGVRTCSDCLALCRELLGEERPGRRAT